MAPIKIKLSLSAAGVAAKAAEDAGPSQSSANEVVANTPAKGAKRSAPPSTDDNGYETPEANDERPQAGPSRLPMTVSTPSRAVVEMELAPTPSRAIETPSRSPKAAKLNSAKGKGKAKTKTKTKGKRPSAIPKRLQSSGPSTPKPPVPLEMLDTPSPIPGEVDVKMEEGEEGSPAFGSPSTPQTYDESGLQTPGTGENGSPFTGEYGTPATAQKQSARWMKIKKPMRELGAKILADLVRRDEVSSGSSLVMATR